MRSEERTRETVQGRRRAQASKSKGRGFLIAGAALLAVVGIAVALDLWMASRVAAPEPDPQGLGGGGESAQLEQDGGIFVDWAYWQSVNPDVVGWIDIPGTGISFPVVQAPQSDPRRYLSHDVFGEWNPYGCPYVDAGCPDGLESRCVVISGHNITFPPAMFHDIERFHDESYAREHDEVIIATPAGAKRLQVLGVNTIAGWERAKRVTFASDSDFWAYRDEVLSQCETRIADEIDLKPGQLVTLCSCSYRFNPQNERTLVYAA